MKIISKDLRDGEKLPERHVFNGMGYQGIISLRIWRGTMFRREPKALLSPAMTRMPLQAQGGGTG